MTLESWLSMEWEEEGIQPKPLTVSATPLVLHDAEMKIISILVF